MTPRDGSATRERILAAAADEFTAHGFAGARVDAIAERAGCNKALLYQHVGDKEALYREVLRCKMGEISRITASYHGDPAAAVGALFDFHAAAPWMARLLQWESLDYGGAAEAIPNAEERREHFARHLTEIRDAQAAGRIDPALDAEQLLFSLISLTVFWFVAPQMGQLITGEDPTGEAALARRRSHVVDVIRRIVEER